MSSFDGPILKPQALGDSPRLLIVRLSSIGDLVFTTSLLRGLRAAYPGARIGWLVRRDLASWLQADPDVDEVHPWAPPESRNPLHWLRALLELRRALRGMRYQVAIDAQGLAKSRVLTALSGAPLRIGFASKEPGRFLLKRLVPKGGDARLIASEYRDLSERLTGQHAPPPSLRLPPSQRPLPTGVVALCPFTTRPQKHWFDEYWPQLAHGLYEQLGLSAVILGGPGDRAHADRLLLDCPPGTRNLAGETRLIEAAQVIAGAPLVIGVDTGLTHMGVASAVPTICLFGSTVPYRTGGAGPTRVLYDERQCSPCRRRPSCAGAFTCMRELSPLRVLAAARDLLGVGP